MSTSHSNVATKAGAITVFIPTFGVARGAGTRGTDGMMRRWTFP